MRYEIELAKEAESDLETLSKSDRRIFKRVLSKTETLAATPFEGKALVGNHKDELSLRIGDYRVVYEIDSARHIVNILTVKHRKNV